MFAGNVGDVGVHDATVRGENINAASFSVATNNGNPAQA